MTAILRGEKPRQDLQVSQQTNASFYLVSVVDFGRRAAFKNRMALFGKLAETSRLPCTCRWDGRSRIPRQSAGCISISLHHGPHELTPASLPHDKILPVAIAVSTALNICTFLPMFQITAPDRLPFLPSSVKSVLPFPPSVS